MNASLNDLAVLISLRLRSVGNRLDLSGKRVTSILTDNPTDEQRIAAIEEAITKIEYEVKTLLDSRNDYLRELQQYEVLSTKHQDVPNPTSNLLRK